MTILETCPDCRVRLPKLDDDAPVHRYLGASASCWAVFTHLNAGFPPRTGSPYNGLLVDAYAAQHFGVPGPQAIQSVAVHLIALYAFLERDFPPHKLVWLRRHGAGESKKQGKHQRFHWLTPPNFDGKLNVADIANAPSLEARKLTLEQYVMQVWELWAAEHRPTVVGWYERYIV